MSAVWLPRGFGRIGFVALVLACGLLAWRWWREVQPPHAANVDPVIGRLLPLDATTPRPEYAKPPGNAQQPDRPHLVNLFASWCLPCRVEAPVLATLTARGIRIDGIAVRDEPAAVARFLKRSGDPYSTVALDPRGRVQAALGTAGLPETYVVDARGRIDYRHRGALVPADINDLTERLR